MIQLVPCNFCGAEEGRVVFEDRRTSPDWTTDDVRITSDIYGNYGRVVRCPRCGLTYLNPRPAPETINACYEHLSDTEFMLEQESRSINAHLSLQAIKRHSKSGRLLDIGCSAGLFLNAARADFETVGVELSHWAVEHARQRLQLKVLEGTLESAGYPDRHFDVVTMIDVIEHVTDPKATLKEVARVLKPGGLFYIVTPNIESLSAQLMGRYWWGLRAAHLYYFSTATLTAGLREAGFEVAECRSYGRLFTYGYWLSRLRNYPALFSWPVRQLVRLLGWEEKVVYINTRDSMEMCAIRLGA